MSEASRHAVLRRVFESVTSGRAGDVAGIIHPRMEFHSVVAGRNFVGVTGLQEWYADVSSYYEELSWEILEIEPVGERDAVRWRFAGRSRETGIEFDTEMSQLWEYGEGVVTRVDVFPDPQGALRAAGVEPPP